MNSLDTHARARTTDVETSHEAAASVPKGDKRRVLRELIASFGGDSFTGAEAVQVLRKSPSPPSEQGIRSRIAELRRGGYVEWATNGEGQQLYRTYNGSRRHRCQRVTPKATLLQGELDG